MTTVKRRDRKFTPEEQEVLREMIAKTAKHLDACMPDMGLVCTALEPIRKRHQEMQTTAKRMSENFEAMTKSLTPALEAISKNWDFQQRQIRICQKSLNYQALLNPQMESLKTFSIGIKATTISQMADFNASFAPAMKSIEATLKVASLEVKRMEEDGKSLVPLMPEYPYQEKRDPAYVERLDHRLDRIEMRIEVLSAHVIAEPPRLAEASDFVFHIEGLYLTYKGERIGNFSSSELRLCQQIFSKPVRHNFLTSDLEDIIYPGGSFTKAYKQENFKKIVKRLNEKMRERANIDRLLAYSVDFIVRID